MVRHLRLKLISYPWFTFWLGFLLLWMQFLKFCRPFRTDYELLAKVSWVVWGELRLAPTWRRGDWSPRVWGGVVCSIKPSLCFRLLFVPSFPSPLLFPSWFKSLFHRFVFILPRTFKNNYWNRSSPSESFPRHGMNYRAGQTSEGRGSFPSEEKWILRVSLDVCANGCFIVQLLHVWMPSIHCPASCISAFWGVESGIFNYCKLTYKICKSFVLQLFSEEDLR